MNEFLTGKVDAALELLASRIESNPADSEAVDFDLIIRTLVNQEKQISDVIKYDKISHERIREGDSKIINEMAAEISRLESLPEAISDSMMAELKTSTAIAVKSRDDMAVKLAESERQNMNTSQARRALRENHKLTETLKKQALVVLTAHEDIQLKNAIISKLMEVNQ